LVTPSSIDLSSPIIASRFPPLTSRRRWFLSQAAADFYFLQNRGYPRASSLEWVGNRHQLTELERLLLHRGVFGQAEALRRRAKESLGADWRKEWMVVDGHNVQITVESSILGRPLLRGNDGALRDLAGESSRFRFTEVSRLAMDMIFRFLEEFRPRKVLFLFDAPMSHSGLLADAYRRNLKSLGIKGDARTAPVPEREFPYSQCVVASSDQAVLNMAVRWLDLARAAIDAAGSANLTADFSSVVLARAQEEFLRNLDFL
jgi:hypothetical protein